MPDISVDDKSIYRQVAGAFGGQPKVTAYHDGSGEWRLDLVSCADQPTRGVTSYGTIGASNFPLLRNGVEFPTRVELLGACPTAHQWFPQALCTAAFYIMKDQWFCCPGAVFETMIEIYDGSLEMKHFAFHNPYLWDSLRTTRLATKTVSWLLAVPISDRECQYCRQHGWDALSDLFERAQIDIFDLQRPSVV
jgi:hypothetical protein